MAKALSVQEVLSMKKAIFPFEGELEEAFGHPERTGVWFIWGNSGNGKSSFVMQLCKELCKYGRVAYDSLEEGDSLTMQNSLKRHGMSSVRRRFLLLNCEPISELDERMSKRKSPDIYVIDSFQYAQMSYKEYIRFKEAHRDKLIIFISHADGRNPAGRAARSVMYDASLKIWVEGYTAFSKGRFFGSTKKFIIWPEESEIYWGENNTPQRNKK